MATLTFTQGLELAETLARESLPVEVHERLSCAVALVKTGCVYQRDDHKTWEVRSQNNPEETYIVNGACTCPDAHYRQTTCKHRLAVQLFRKSLLLIQQSQQSATAAPTAVEPVQPSGHVEPLYEAPASVNVRVIVQGHECQWTLRGHDEAALLTRLQALLSRKNVQPLPAKPAPARRPYAGTGDTIRRDYRR